MEEFDPGVKEGAAWALGYIARHNAELAQSVVDSGAVPLLVLCIQEPELSLKRIAASALSDISKHSPGKCVLRTLFIKYNSEYSKHVIFEYAWSKSTYPCHNTVAL